MQILARLKKLEATRPARGVSMSFVTLQNKGFAADVRLWNGVVGSGTESVVSYHKTKQAAEKAVSAAIQRYGAYKGTAITVNLVLEERQATIN